MEKIKKITMFTGIGIIAAFLLLGCLWAGGAFRKGNSEKIPDSLIALMERNPETRDFVMGYPHRKSTEPDLSGYDRREKIPLFLQWDPQWGYEKYGSDMIAITGCGPTVLAMAGFYLRGENSFNPKDVAAFAEDRGYYVKGQGSSWTLISQGGPELGLTVTELPLWEDTIRDYLHRGLPVICAMGPGDFTSTGHYLILTGEERGMYTLNDPNSIQNSQRTWTYEELAPQIRNLWGIE